MAWQIIGMLISLRIDAGREGKLVILIFILSSSSFFILVFQTLHVKCVCIYIKVPVVLKNKYEEIGYKSVITAYVTDE